MTLESSASYGGSLSRNKEHRGGQIATNGMRKGNIWPRADGGIDPFKGKRRSTGESKAQGVPKIYWETYSKVDQKIDKWGGGNVQHE